MGTANYWTMDNFPLYVIDPEEEDFNYIFGELSIEADRENETLMFHRISVKSGYYAGIQFYVELSGDDPEECDNRESHYNWDLYRSEAIRKYQSEQRKIQRWLKEVAQFYGMDCLECVGRFSNGEAVYQRCTS